MYRGVGTDDHRMGAQTENGLPGCRPHSILLPSHRLALPSVMNLNCLLTKRRAPHFSKPLSLYHKASPLSAGSRFQGNPLNACSILNDTLNPIWLEVCSFTLMHCLLLIAVGVCTCERACAGQHPSVKIGVGVCICVGVCHVFAVISFSC